MENNIISLLTMVEAFLFVGVYMYKIHKKKIETSALQDKTMISLIFYSMLGIIKYSLLLTERGTGYENLFSLMQNITFMVIAFCIGIEQHQRFKDNSTV